MQKKPKLKVLVLGDGQLAREIMRRRPSRNTVQLSRDFVDINDRARLLKLVKHLDPAVIVNCTGFNNCELSENPKSDAIPVNFGAVLNLQDVAETCGARLIHFCTGYVYSGKRQKAYTEEDVPVPLNAFAASKLRGSAALLESPINYVFRTSGLWSNHPGANNLAYAIYAALRKGEPFQVEASKFLSFTAASTLAEIVQKTIKAIHDDQPYPGGLYHAVDKGYGTVYDFAKCLAKAHDQDAELILPGKPSKMFKLPDTSVLSTVKLESRLGDILFKWETNLTQFEAW